MLAGDGTTAHGNGAVPAIAPARPGESSTAAVRVAPSPARRVDEPARAWRARRPPRRRRPPPRRRGEDAASEPRGPAARRFPLPTTVGRDVVRTAQLTLQVADPAAAAAASARRSRPRAGSSPRSRSTPRVRGSCCACPSPALDRLVDDLAATGTVLARSGRTEDATDQVVDLDSRVASQQASVTRVRALLAQARSIGDVVAVESALASREADLDSLERRLAALRDRVALSTLTVELHGPAAAPQPAGPPRGFASGLGAGWAGLKVIGAALATAVGFLLPFLPVLAVGAGVACVVVRRRRARRQGGGPAPAAP